MDENGNKTYQNMWDGQNSSKGEVRKNFYLKK